MAEGHRLGARPSRRASSFVPARLAALAERVGATAIARCAASIRRVEG